MSRQAQPRGVDEYYKSIQRPFEETHKFEETEGEVGFLKGLITLLFVFSLIPLVPYILSLTIRRYFHPRFVPLLGHQVSVASFWFIWVLCFAVTLLLFISFVVRHLSEEPGNRLLSVAQMRFAYCYATLDEISKYQINRLNQHLVKASEYLDRLGKSIWRFTAQDFLLGLPEAEMFRGRMLPGAPIKSLTERLRWFKLEPQTETILNAISDFPTKFRDRLRDKKDLLHLVGILEDLATYLYSCGFRKIWPMNSGNSGRWL